MRQTARRHSWLGGAGLLLGVLLASPALGVGIFTLDAPVVIDSSNDAGTGVRGQLTVVTDFDLSDVLTSDGTVNFGTQDVFLVQLELFGNSAIVDEISFSVEVPGFFTNLMSNPKGAGALNDVSLGLFAPSTVTADNTAAFAAIFEFSPVLDGGNQTVRLFSTYQSVSGGDLLAVGQNVTFMISSGELFTVKGTIIPEPGTALLLGGGLVALLGATRAADRRRRP